MGKVTMLVYSYEELSETAKEKAINEERESIHETFDSGFITETFADRLSDKGYPTDDVRWSLTYSQGDGVAFYGNISDEGLNKIAKRLLSKKEYKLFKDAHKKLEFDLDFLIESIDSRHDHYNTMRVDYEFNNYSVDEVDEDSEELKDYIILSFSSDFETLLDSLKDRIQADVKDISRELDNIGYAEIEHQPSDETIIKYFNDFNYRFFENGSFYGTLEEAA